MTATTASRRRLIAAARGVALRIRRAALRYELAAVENDMRATPNEIADHERMAEALRSHLRRTHVQAAMLRAEINTLDKEITQ